MKYVQREPIEAEQLTDDHLPEGVVPVANESGYLFVDVDGNTSVIVFGDYVEMLPDGRRLRREKEWFEGRYKQMEVDR